MLKRNQVRNLKELQPYIEHLRSQHSKWLSKPAPLMACGSRDLSIYFLADLIPILLVTLINTFLSLDENVISQVSGGSVELFRSKASEHKQWQENQCFELLFTSPYADPDVYYSFLDENPPSCAVSGLPKILLFLGGKFEF